MLYLCPKQIGSVGKILLVMRLEFNKKTITDSYKLDEANLVFHLGFAVA